MKPQFTTEVNLCTCNNCGGIFIDKNPQINAKRYFVDATKLEELDYIKEDSSVGVEAYVGCPSCQTDDYLTDEVNEEEAMGRGIIDTY